MTNQTIAILGGTGKTGKWAIKAALQRGANVRVLCRKPDKLKHIYSTLWIDGKMPEEFFYDTIVDNGRLVIVKGSVPIGKKGQKSYEDIKPTDEQTSSINELVNGSTHILSFLGMDPKNKAPICRPGIEAIMNAAESCDMKQKPKILIMSSIILSDSYAQGKAAWGCCGCVGSLMRWNFLREVFDDMEAAEEYAINNRGKKGLDVTLLRATVLSDKKNYYMDYAVTDQAKYYIVAADELKKVKMKIDRQHVVECFMDVVVDKEGRKFSNCEWSIFDM